MQLSPSPALTHYPCAQNCVFRDATQRHIVIVDFGLAMRAEAAAAPPRADAAPPAVVGTCGYVAPETVSRMPRYSIKSDVWALGVVFFVLLAGEAPFGGDENRGVTLSLVRRGAFVLSPSRWRCVSTEARALVRWMLRVDPAARPDIAGVLAHAAFRLAVGRNGPLPGTLEALRMFNGACVRAVAGGR